MYILPQKNLRKKKTINLAWNMLTNTNIYIYIYIFNSVEKERLSFSSVHCAVAIKSKAEYVASRRIRRDRYIYTCGDKRAKKKK